MHFGPLFAFSIPAMLGDVSHYLYRWVDTITISVFLDLSEVGIYNAALRTSLLIGLIFMAANAIYSTMASGYFHTGRGEQLTSALHLSTRWCLTLALPIGVIFLVAAEQVLSLWGPEFTRGADVLKLLVFAQLLAVPTGILAYTLLMCEKQMMELADTLVCLALIVGFNLVLIPRNGLMGAAQALLLANAIGLGLRWVQLHRNFGFHPFDRRIAKPLVAGVLAAGAALLARAPVKETLAGLLGGPAALATVLASVAVLGLLVLVVFLGTQLLLGFEEEDRAIPGMLMDRLRGTDSPTDGGAGGASPGDA
jgi:O-antigen/teichoic acid export membrane protein